MRNSDYWKQRFIQLEKSQNAVGASAFSGVEQLYWRAQKEIEGQIAIWYQRFADKNKISLAQSRQWLTGENLKEFKRDIQDYIKYGREHALLGGWEKRLESVLAKKYISKLDALNIQTQHSLEVLFADQHKTLRDMTKKIYINGYYHTAYELQRGFNIGWGISGLEQSRVEEIISKPWANDKLNFSQRIWNSKQKLIADIQKELTQNLLTGGDPQKAINAIAKKINTSKSNARRLIMTEQAYFGSAAQKQCFEDLGVEQFEVIATLDQHTSNTCRNLNGKVFPMKDYQVGVTAPPFHVFCRSTTAPVLGENFELNGEPIPEGLSYEEWKKEFVQGQESNIDYMSNSFRPEISNRETTLTVGNISITTKKVENSRFKLLTDTNNRRNKAVRLVERQLQAVSDMLPDDFVLPTTAVVDFEACGISSSAIAGFERVSGIMFINSKYDTVEKILGYVNKQAGQFANKTEYAPILHELGHNFYENSVKALAKSKNLEYNGAKDIIDDRIYNYIHENNIDGNFLLKNISRYADDGFSSREKYTEIIAECFSIQSENTIAAEILKLLGGGML